MSNSINPAELAHEILKCCLEDDAWPCALLDALIDEAVSSDEGRARAGTNALFGILVERLGDLFEPRLALDYALIFSQVCGRVLGLDELLMVDRYGRLRVTRRFEGADPESVFVLSRVTLGADVAVTSVVLDAVKRRFPSAEILFVGPEKNYDLFAADRRISHQPFGYSRRATLRERLERWTELAELLHRPNSIVIDPDSRLTQLGLLPVCEEERHYLFESRAYGGDSDLTLPELTSRWCEETFDVAGAAPFVCPVPAKEFSPPGTITVSLGTGENGAKRVRDPFEAWLLETLTYRGPALIDKGAGGEETVRVERAIASLGEASGKVRTWYGAFAPFAARIARSAMYAGYDSSGQHVAAACGVPLLTVFSGYASERTFQRWRPWGDGPIEVVRVAQNTEPGEVLGRVQNALDRLEPHIRNVRESRNSYQYG